METSAGVPQKKKNLTVQLESTHRKGSKSEHALVYKVLHLYTSLDAHQQINGWRKCMYAQNGALFSAEETQNYVLFRKMDRIRNHYV